MQPGAPARAPTRSSGRRSIGRQGPLVLSYVPSVTCASVTYHGPRRRVLEPHLEDDAADAAPRLLNAVVNLDLGDDGEFA